ncbi:phosphopantothenoylcysteine decarboxylase/phosphopantothenate/cysteine ligase [Arcobacter nitrofigilis DSM 7299]|uniref:Coenzyme A biosynthesis bifunctional protein CoaBC n=1 Tax=Arcobacter nitrofigilis (strain ATCC 33309 / DSM 7299 / CCUG 15893 / LMG 7604 / NCTC 12251 / CI) TaxID=572480 RepID=D5V7E3_ARCNC|nr:bifunctional phosphopantothenoylcysteine decarboxylase/phosphopantothenate--cysteine ligase CoaBC [Arcobacter nitrofigilis]ADG94563.1 phosphopantothenoylcysteine decarboxylase/phosphopantothenate/cysteine ligase [Arcobacter nitrofigilis DSM 7299]
MLKNRNILIGVTGSIAIYKTLELIRLYIKAGANVKVIMTSSAKKFITPLTFETISQSQVLDDTNESWDKNSDYNHIAIGKWADIFVLAPASANTINKLSHGIADNILTQTALAYPRVKLLCPAANTNMIQNPMTSASMKMLKLCNYKIIEPVSKELACRDIGTGALSEVDDIYYATLKELLKDDYWENRKVVLSGGGTVEKIDDVRYISNFSSGKMASSLALALYLKGADVCLVSSRGYEELPKEIHTIEVKSSQEMFEYLQKSINVAKKGIVSSTTLMDDSNPSLIQKKPYLFMVAAVSDYIPSYPQNGKLKKSMLGEKWNLELKQNIDILSSLNRDDIYTIGFKAEMDKIVAYENAKNMKVQKNIDAVCLNIIDENNTFGSDSNKIELMANDKIVSFDGDKFDVSLNIINTLSLEFHE